MKTRRLRYTASLFSVSFPPSPARGVVRGLPGLRAQGWLVPGAAGLPGPSKLHWPLRQLGCLGRGFGEREAGAQALGELLVPGSVFGG